MVPLEKPGRLTFSPVLSDTDRMAGFFSRPRPPEIIRYEAEESKLREARREASAGFEAAKATYDFEKAQQWLEKLTAAGDAFKEFRKRLPEDTLHIINAEKILAGSGYEKIGFLTRLFKRPLIEVTIPAGVSDIEALEALNLFYSQRSKEGRSAVSQLMFKFLSDEGGVAARDVMKPRVFSLALHVHGTEGKTREEQSPILAEKGLQFAQPIEQALGGAIALCLGEKIPPRYLYRGTDSQWALDSSSWPIGFEPLSFVGLGDLNRHAHVVASGVRIASDGETT